MYGLLPSSLHRCDAACAPPPPPRFSVIGRKCRFSPEYLSLPVCSIFLPSLRCTWINPTVAGNAILHARKRRYKSCLIIREHGAQSVPRPRLARWKLRFLGGGGGDATSRPIIVIPHGVRPIEWIGGAHEWLASCSLSGRVRIVHLRQY